jgi:hypothetical protein
MACSYAAHRPIVAVWAECAGSWGADGTARSSVRPIIELCMQSLGNAPRRGRRCIAIVSCHSSRSESGSWRQRVKQLGAGNNGLTPATSAPRLAHPATGGGQERSTLVRSMSSKLAGGAWWLTAVLTAPTKFEPADGVGSGCRCVGCVVHGRDSAIEADGRGTP